MNLFWCLFLMPIACELLEYDLTKDNPSYALRDSRFERKQRLTIHNGCSGCTIRIDFSKIGCAKEQIALTQTDGPRITCYDEVPFTVNGQDMNVKTCNGFVPMDSRKLKYLFTCAFAFTAARLEVRYKNTTNIRYALGFTVVEWTNAEDAVVLVPFITAPFALHLQAPYSPVIVQDQTAVDIQSSDENNNEMFELWLGIGRSATSKANFLIETNNYNAYSFTSSVITVVSRNATMTLILSPSKFAPGGPIGLSPMYSASFEYPWLFDEPERYSQCFEQFWESSNFVTTRITVVSNTGGWLTLTAGHLWDVNETSVETNLTLANEKNYAFNIVSLQFKIVWCPNLNVSHRGFFIKGEDAAVEKLSTTPYLSLVPVQLLESIPAITLDSTMFKGNTAYQVEVMYCNDCALIADYCFVTDKTRKYTFDSPLPNDTEPAVALDTFLGNKTISCHRTRLTNNYTFFSFSSHEFALTVMAAEYVYSEMRTFPIPFNDLPEFLDRDFALQFPALNGSHFLTFKTVFPSVLLRSFRAARSRACAYDFYENSIPSFVDLEEPLLTFMDEVHFQEQYLSSTIFTVSIPENCSPTVALRIRGNSEAPVEFCSGTVIVTSEDIFYYFGDLNTHFAIDNTLEFSYFCDNKIDLAINFVAAVDGQLNISVLTNDEWLNESVSLVRLPKRNLTYDGVTKIKFVYNGLENVSTTEQGFALKLYAVNKVAPTRTTTVVHSTETKSDRQVLLSFLCFLCSYYFVGVLE